MAAFAGAVFHGKVLSSIKDSFHAAAAYGSQLCHNTANHVMSLGRVFCRSAGALWHDVTREARLLGEGLAHLNSADFQTQTEFRRDLANCAIETGLCVAEGVELEVSAVIAAAEVGEKVINSPPGSVGPGEIISDFATSLASSAAAAVSAAAHMFMDLEKSGQEWEAAHPRP